MERSMERSMAGSMEVRAEVFPNTPGVTAKAGLTLRSAEFRRVREAGWRQLEGMVAKVEKGGLGTLSASEAQDMAILYRSAVSSLSVARGIALDRNLLLYLEDLTLRAYLVVYGPRTGVLENMAEFFRRGWPRAVRSMKRELLLIAVIFFAGAIAGYALVRRDLENFHLFVPPEISQGRGPGSTREELLNGEIFQPWPGFVDAFVVFANFLFRHNARIGLLSFGLGFMLGVPTVMLIGYNGGALGAFMALHAELGLTWDFLGWVSIHGVTEILAVLLFGAGGLLIAETILFPGRLPRLENLAREGRRAAQAAVGSVVMLFAAGIIEGGFRQLIAHTGGRCAFAAATAALWACYFIFAGRDGEDQREVEREDGVPN
ncbi:MAG: stage II sporulation protein M [Synergistaceae bacterium]|nr:stage II sporulation protein M [Synergistaceae bacterium]